MPELNTLLFYAFAFLTVAFAFIVVFSKNVIYAAVALFVTLFGIAALFLLLNADFLALTQVMVYIGGILVLLIFGIMLTNKITDVDITTSNFSTVPAAAISAGIFAIILFVLFTTKWNLKTPIKMEDTVTGIGYQLMTVYLLPFEIASVILLVALIGAAMYSRKK